MSDKHYNKLIRDNIPTIIKDAGKVPHTYTANDDEYHQKLIGKLKEETLEYEESNSVEELADILEVVEALIKTHDISLSDLHEIKNKKRDTNGGFDQKLILTKVSDD